MRKARLLLLIACVLLWPSSAHASFWGWLEQMSGPGPFGGGDLAFTFLCNRGEDGFGSCWPGLTSGTKDHAATKRHPITGTVVLKFGWYGSSEEDPRFRDLPATDADNFGSVRVSPVSVLYLFRHGAFDFGAGAGFWRISASSGAEFPAFFKFALTPANVALSPLALRPKWKDAEWTHFLRLEVDTAFIPAGFKGSEFNNTRTTFKVDHEFLTRASIVIDGGQLLSLIK
jgi:hypothetical protein